MHGGTRMCGALVAILTILAFGAFSAEAQTKGKKPKKPRSKKVEKPKPVVEEPPPPTPPDFTTCTILEEYQWLTRKQPKESDADTALRTAIAFALASGDAAGERAVGFVDTVGYQALPTSGALPEIPSKPLPRADVGKLVDSLRKADVGQLPARIFQALQRKEAKDSYPAAADWMLAEDVLVLLQPVDPASSGWLKQPCYLVIRLRAGKPSIVGGTFLESLKLTPDGG